MGRQIIFCMETDRKARTDWVYIQTTITRFYNITNEISLKPVFMGGKTNYKNPKIIKQINDLVKLYSRNGNSTVCYCVDTDQWDVDSDRNRELQVIQEYCAERGYEFIWFCRDVEEVYWGKSVPGSEKIRTSKRFRSSNQISNVSEAQLSSAGISKCKSNILKVLDLYLER